MSVWQRPTTADIAIRAFSTTPEELLIEAVLGMQNIIMSESGKISANSSALHNEEWIIETEGRQTFERLLVMLLEEVLYRCEVEEQWFVKGVVRLTEGTIQLQSSWADANSIEREIEIKAVTRHELRFYELAHDEITYSDWEEIPDLVGPGWICDVVFDI